MREDRSILIAAHGQPAPSSSPPPSSYKSYGAICIEDCSVQDCTHVKSNDNLMTNFGRNKRRLFPKTHIVAVFGVVAVVTCSVASRFSTQHRTLYHRNNNFVLSSHRYSHYPLRRIIHTMKLNRMSKHVASYGASAALEELQNLVYREEERQEKKDRRKHVKVKKNRHRREEQEQGDNGEQKSQKRYLPPSGCEATVMIIRHCEKDTLKEHCDYLGFERAVHFAELFASAPPNDKNQEEVGHEEGSNDPASSKMSREGWENFKAKWPAPSFLYALNPGRSHHKNFREVETIQPVADKYDLSINTDFDVKSTHSLAKQIFSALHSGDMCGRLAIVSWKHSEIPSLAQSLGCGPTQGCPMDFYSLEFDAVWQLKFVYDGAWYYDLPRGASPMSTNDRSVLVTGKERHKWKVFGSIQRQGFDPLEFSMKKGDYPVGGTDHGGRWREEGNATVTGSDRKQK